MPGPGRKKKPFIDKKNAVSFHLVHRSQKDPLQADEDAPQRVLLEANSEEATGIRRDEQKKYGILFDDDYDYMQHLRDINEINEVTPGETIAASHNKNKLQLPSTVFASEAESEVGLLNKAAPLRGPLLDWDPDIVAGLDDDFDFENPDNELEDDFIVQAMAGEVEFVEDEEQYSGLQKNRNKIDEDDEVASNEADFSDVGSDFGSYGDDEDAFSFNEEETKSRFTNYSITSSVIKRNQGLTLLDDRFEKIFEEYGDEELGALDDNEITGCVPQNSDLLNDALETFEQQIREIKLKDVVEKYEGEYQSDESDNEMIQVQVEEKPKEKWDCESILSTYSTLYNHPKTIREPSKIKPIRMKMVGGEEIPAESLHKRGLSHKELQQLENDSNRAEYVPTFRPKDETPEEKKARKQAVKEERRARREEKKSTKLAFKSEKQKQERDNINAQRSKQGVRIV